MSLTRTFVRMAWVVATPCVALTAARAQYGGQITEGTRVSFLLGAGGVFPAGGIAARVDPNAGGLLGVLIRGPGSPIGFRFDDTYSQASGANGWVAIDAITFDAEWMSKGRGLFHWYGLVGAGPYYTTGSALGTAYAGYAARWSLGLNGGVGAVYGRRVSVFVESRYHVMFQGGRAFQFIPLMVGVALR